MSLFDDLAAPFDPAIVSWRVGPTNADKSKGMALAYIDARDVMRRLDEVCGAENWQNDYPWSDGKRVVCRIGIRIPLIPAVEDGMPTKDEFEWVWKTDGAGDTDMEGDKGALSDAFKRAAVRWGIGRYLYDVDAPWVAIQPRGKSYFIPDSELRRLEGMLRKEMMPDRTAAAAAATYNAKPPSTEAEAARSLYKRIAQEIVDAAAPEEVGRVLDVYTGDINGLPAVGQNGIRELARKRYNELRAT